MYPMRCISFPVPRSLNSSQHDTSGYRGQEVNFSECGAHMVINLLKKFLHELPDALLSSVLYQRYISAVRTFIH